MSILRAAVACVVVALLVGGAGHGGSSAGPAREIVFGVIAPLTGGKAEQGMQFKEGAEVAVAEINVGTRLLDRRIRLEMLDDRGLPNEAAAAAQKLAANPDVVACIGPSSTASSSAAIPILERARITCISPSASTATLVTKNRFFYIMYPPTTAYGPMIPEFAMKRAGAKSVAIINVKDDWGEGVTQITREWAQKNRLPVVAEASYTQGARDFKAQLTAMLSRNPGALILNTHYTEGALITKQARDLGYTGPILAQGTNVYSQFIRLAGDAAEGVVAWVDFLPNLKNDAVQKAVAKFKRHTGKEPLNYHLTTYDAVYIFAAAIRKVGNTEDRDAVTRTVGQTKNFAGITGKFGYDAERLPQRELFWVTVKGGEWVLYQGK